MKLNIKKQHLTLIYVVNNLLKARTSATIADIINDEEEEDTCMQEVGFSIAEFRDVYYALSNISEGVMSTVNNEMKGYLLPQLLAGSGLNLNQLMDYRLQPEPTDKIDEETNEIIPYVPRVLYGGYIPLRVLPEDYEPTEDQVEFVKLIDCMVDIDNENIRRLDAMYKAGKELAKIS